MRDLFHTVKRALPDRQELLSVNADMDVGQALEQMMKANVGQVPVVSGAAVLGVFSYRSLAHGILNLPKKEPFRLSLPVELFTEDFKFVSLGDSLDTLIEELDIKDGVLVGSESNLQGVLTTIDALGYFYSVASPYVLLREIELSIRELIRLSTTTEDLQGCIGRSLKQHYEDQKRAAPSSLEAMTFNDYVMLLRFQGNWQFFKEAWGGTCNTVAAKLEALPDLRNAVFHFKRELKIEEYDILRDRRDWLLKRMRKVEADRKAGANA